MFSLIRCRLTAEWCLGTDACECAGEAMWGGWLPSPSELILKGEGLAGVTRTESNNSSRPASNFIIITCIYTP
jgi:hypothetical protein